MKTLSLVLSTFWAVARSTPTVLSLLWTVARNTPAFLRHLPATLILIGKIRAAFGSEAVQVAIKAFGEYIDRIAPPAPTADSTGNTPANPGREKRRRFIRFMNRTRLAGQIPENEVRNICAKNLIQPYTEELA